jgi:hypothetical protein
VVEVRLYVVQYCYCSCYWRKSLTKPESTTVSITTRGVFNRCVGDAIAHDQPGYEAAEISYFRPEAEVLQKDALPFGGWVRESMGDEGVSDARRP